MLQHGPLQVQCSLSMKSLAFLCEHREPVLIKSILKLQTVLVDQLQAHQSSLGGETQGLDRLDWQSTAAYFSVLLFQDPERSYSPLENPAISCEEKKAPSSSKKNEDLLMKVSLVQLWLQACRLTSSVTGWSQSRDDHDMTRIHSHLATKGVEDAVPMWYRSKFEYSDLIEYISICQ